MRRTEWYRADVRRSLSALVAGFFVVACATACSSVNCDDLGRADQVAQRMKSQVPSISSVEVVEPYISPYLRYMGSPTEGVISAVLMVDSQSQCSIHLDDGGQCAVGLEEFTTSRQAEKRARYLEGYSSQNPPDNVIPHVRGRYLMWFEGEMSEDVQKQYLDEWK